MHQVLIAERVWAALPLSFQALAYAVPRLCLYLEVPCVTLIPQSPLHLHSLLGLLLGVTSSAGAPTDP